MAETLRYGANGETVRALQTLLNSMGGYALTVDGQFGESTRTAVLDYQSRKGIGADGIVHTGTWEALEADAARGQEAAAQQERDGASRYGGAPTYAGMGTAKPTYTKSQGVSDAESELESYRLNAPGAYQSPYADQIQQMLDDILGRPDFQYDTAADPFYQQYAQRYEAAGRRAMRDTVGQAAALTGGYANSYAATAGQQAYQRYLQEMADAAPDFEQNAYRRYTAQGDAMREQLSTLQGMDDRSYDAYRNDVSDYRAGLNDRAKRAEALSQQEYDRYLDELGAWRDERDFGFEQYLAELVAWQNQRDDAYRREQDALQQENWLREYELSLAGKSSGGRSGGSGGGTEKTASKTNVARSDGSGGASRTVAQALSAQSKKNIRKGQSAK